MGFLDSIFGSDPSVQQTTSSNLTPTQSDALTQFLDSYRTSGMAGSAGTPAKGYSGPFAAPLSNLETMSLSALENLSTQMSQAPLYQQSQQALGDVMSQGPQDISDYFTKAVENPMLKDFQTRILPSLQGTFAGNNAFGSDKTKATALMTQQLTDSLSSSRASTAFTALQNQQQNKIAAASATPGVMAAPVNNQIAMLNAGQIPQQVAQQQVTGQYTDFLNTRQAQQTQIQQMLGALGIPAVNNQTVVQPGQSGSIGGIISGLGSVAAMAMFSDERMKANVKPVGKTPGGHKLYEFNYRGKPEKIIGVLAGEVEKIDPKAVAKHISGMKVVDYSRIH